MVSSITKWAENKPLFITMIAIELAFDAEYCFECAKQIKRMEGFIYELPVLPLDEWLRETSRALHIRPILNPPLFSDMSAYLISDPPQNRPRLFLLYLVLPAPFPTHVSTCGFLHPLL